MDATSEKGLAVRDEVDKIIEIIEKEWDSVLVQFSNDSPVDFDGLISENKVIGAIFEFKVRDVQVAGNKMEYKGKDYDSVILTQSKIDKCKEYSTAFRVPFLFIFYARKSASVHFIQITDSQGNYLFEYKTKESTTQKSINGGVAKRKNAYLPLKYAKRLI